MNKKLFAAMLAAAVTISAAAQTVQPAQAGQEQEPAKTSEAEPQYKFGYIDYRAVFESMPEYAQAQKSLSEIKAKYDNETTHNEESFKRMYLEFLQGQKDFPQTIMLKRQKELQDALDNGIKFRNQVTELLTKAQQDLEKPIRAKLDSAIALVGKEKGYDVIVNTGELNFPFINKLTGEDVTLSVQEKLKAIKP